jgi:hypothetical protein
MHSFLGGKRKMNRQRDNPCVKICNRKSTSKSHTFFPVQATCPLQAGRELFVMAEAPCEVMLWDY